MSSEKSVTPQIRFKGFTEAWEQRKFSDLTDEVTEKTITEDEDILLSCAITGIYTNSEYFSHFRGRSNIGYLKVKRNMLILSAQNLHLGNANVNLKFDHGIISPAYKTFDLKNWNPVFANAWIKRPRANKFWDNATTAGASLCRKNIVWKDLAEQIIYIPTIEKEQCQIGSIFELFDNLITLHQRKLDVLKKIKSALLEKMFPKDGSDIPEIRFTGFTEAWEQRELGDIAEIIGGGTPDTNNPSYWDGDIDWYSPAELGEQIYAIGSRRRITKEGYKNSSAKLLPANKTILFTSRAGIGTTAILCRSACTNQGFQSLVINDNTDLYFIYSMSSRIKDFAISKASGSTFLEISGKQLATMNLFLPQLNEQRKIGQYFKSLDNLITLHQRKLNALKKIKSALLEKMFV